MALGESCFVFLFYAEKNKQYKTSKMPLGRTWKVKTSSKQDKKHLKYPSGWDNGRTY